MLRPPQTGYLGPPGTYSYRVAKAHSNGAQCEPKPFPTIPDIFDAFVQGEIAHAVVPLINPVGVVYETLEGLIEHPSIRICKEVLLPIQHCLLGGKGQTLSGIRVLYCHYQPRMQCRRWIHKNGLDAKVIDAPSTAAAAQMAIKDREPGAVAIASEDAARLYGMTVLERGVNDKPENTTRFIILNHTFTQPTGNDRTTIFFGVPNPNRAGALYDALGVFKGCRVNLSKIDSETVKDQLGQLIIWVDADGHAKDPHITRCLQSLADQNVACNIRVVGSYPKAPSPFRQPAVSAEMALA